MGHAFFPLRSDLEDVQTVYQSVYKLTVVALFERFIAYMDWRNSNPWEAAFHEDQQSQDHHSYRWAAKDVDCSTAQVLEQRGFSVYCPWGWAY